MSETRLTPERRAELARLCEAATPGPWAVYETPNPISVPPGGSISERRIGTTWDHPQLEAPAPVVTLSTTIGERQHQVSIDEADAAFIAAARTALPEALAEVDRLTARLREAESLLTARQLQRLDDRMNEEGR